MGEEQRRRAKQDLLNGLTYKYCIQHAKDSPIAVIVRLPTNSSGEHLIQVNGFIFHTSFWLSWKSEEKLNLFWCPAAQLIHRIASLLRNDWNERFSIGLLRHWMVFFHTEWHIQALVAQSKLPPAVRIHTNQLGGRGKRCWGKTVRKVRTGSRHDLYMLLMVCLPQR